MTKRKEWNELTTIEANKIREQHCKGCKYLYGDGSQYNNCNYLLMTKRARGCDVRDCKLKEKN